MTTIENSTESTVTDAQIRALRDEAAAAGDYAQVDLCNRALCSDDETTDQDGNKRATSALR